MGIGKRNQLHPRRRESVEPRQLAAACSKGQRERLNTVTEEVATSQNICGVEVVINLPNQAREPVE